MSEKDQGFSLSHIFHKKKEEPIEAPCVNLDFDGDSFNTLVFKDMKENTKTGGKLFVGGDAYMTACSVGSELTELATLHDKEDVFVVAGKLEFSSGTINNGNMVWAGKGYFKDSVKNSLDNGTCVVHDKHRFDFANAERYFRDMAATLSFSNSTGTTLWKSDQRTLSFTGLDNGRKEVFACTCDQLGQATDINFQKVDTSPSIVVNVIGKDNCVMRDGLECHGSKDKSENIIWNFVDTYHLHLENVAVEGSILAPKVHITSTGGDIRGQVICRTWEGPCVQQNVPFGGCIFGGPESQFSLLSSDVDEHVFQRTHLSQFPEAK